MGKHEKQKTKKMEKFSLLRYTMPGGGVGGSLHKDGGYGTA